MPQTVHVEVRPSDPVRLLRRKGRLLRAALRWSPDVVYHRYTLAYPALVTACRRHPVVVEVNTNDVVEYDLLSSRRGLANRLTRGLVLSRVAGLLFVTEELRHDPVFARYARASEVVANGVDLEASPPPAPPSADTNARLVFIGGPGCPWHGLDKVVWLARRHPEWAFDIVGPLRDEALDAPDNVVFHGQLATADYRPLLRRADVGIGSLALFRKGMTEASPLKVREYLANGLPALIGYADTDFPHGAPFLLPVPNREDGVEVAEPQIVEFVRRWKGSRVPRSELAHLDVRRKETARLRFLAGVAGVRGAGIGA